MIIVYSDTPINQQAVAALVAKNPQHVFSLEDISDRAVNPLVIDPKDKTLTILDLNANGNLQKLYSTEVMAKRLHTIGFLTHIDTIQLLVSDIYSKKPMLGLATSLSCALVELNPNTTIEIKVPADLLKSTLIVPPEAPDGDWCLYTASSAKIKGITDIDTYKQNMELHFSGAIEDALKNPDYAVAADSTREAYGRELVIPARPGIHP